MIARRALALSLAIVFLLAPVLHAHWGAGGEPHCNFCLNHISATVETIEVVTTLEQQEAEPSREPLDGGRTLVSQSHSRAPPV